MSKITETKIEFEYQKALTSFFICSNSISFESITESTLLSNR